MLARLAAGALFAGAVALSSSLGEGVAFAQPPPSAAHVMAVHGTVIVAVTDGAGPAARALAREVYRDPALRPSIDEPTARALTADLPPAAPPPPAAAPATPSAAPSAPAAPPAAPPAASASASAVPAAPPPPSAPIDPRLKEIGDLRVSISTSSTDITSRHLLASLGATLGAELVIAVSLEGGRPVGKTLHVATASWDRVEIGATIETAGDGARSYQWPGAATTIEGMLPHAALATKPEEPKKPVATAPPPPPKRVIKKPDDQKPAWASPWFWGTIGGVAAVGITVFVISRVTSGPGSVHLEGTVSP